MPRRAIALGLVQTAGELARWAALAEAVAHDPDATEDDLRETLEAAAIACRTNAGFSADVLRLLLDVRDV